MVSLPEPRGPAEDLADPDVVCVGVDGSEASVQALIWALRHALEHDAVVEVVTAWPLHAPVFVREVPGHFNESRWRAVEAQARTLATARSLMAHPPAHTTRLENAPALEVLVRRSASAKLLVLGTDSAGAPGGVPARTSLPGLALRSARCPVVLVSRDAAALLPEARSAAVQTSASRTVQRTASAVPG